jgi:hypothetical protein
VLVSYAKALTGISHMPGRLRGGIKMELKIEITVESSSYTYSIEDFEKEDLDGNLDSVLAYIRMIPEKVDKIELKLTLWRSTLTYYYDIDDGGGSIEDCCKNIRKLVLCISGR